MTEERIDLEKQLYALVQTFPEQVADDVRFMRDMHGMAQMRLQRSIYGHRLAEWDETTEFPANWFQHLKKQLGLKHQTVRTYATVTRRRLYPDLPVLPQNSVGVSYLHEDRQDWQVGPR